MAHMNTICIKPSKINGRIKAPPSKSQTMRALLFATLATGNSQINAALISPDTLAMINACRQLGATIVVKDNCISVQGTAGNIRTADDVIQAGNSGQVLRFIAAIAALGSDYTIITGDHSIRYKRPMQAMLEGLEQLEVLAVSSKNDGYAPVIIKGPLQAGQTTLNGQDSQPISALLIALAFAGGPSTIYVDEPGETPWVALTLDWFDRLNIHYKNEDFKIYSVQGDTEIDGFEYTVPGDFSSIAFPLIAALSTNSDIIIDNLDFDDIQGDKAFIEVLQAMNADLHIKGTSLIVHGTNSLHGITVDINHCIDSLPALAAIACFANSPTEITGAHIARHKESDRIACICKELTKMGARIDIREDGLLVHPCDLQGATLKSHHDHRIAMALAAVALAASSQSSITDCDCIAKSYPSFVTELRSLGAGI